MKNNELEAGPSSKEAEARGTENIWTRVMQKLPKFGEKTLTREQKDDIYNGANVYGADEVDFLADKEKLDKVIDRMNEWGEASVFYGKVIGGDGTLSAEELTAKREGITHEMADYIIDVYGIRKAPQIEITREIGLLDGGYQNEDNRVLISEAMMKNTRSPKEVMRFLAHELMHCYDDTEIAGDGSQLGAELKYNNEHYFKEADRDPEAYSRQLSERRAFAREKAVMEQFEEYTAEARD